MVIADVNVLLGAFGAPDPANDGLRAWTARSLSGPELFGLSELVLSAVVRISTNRHAYPVPATADEALDYCAALRSGPAVTIVAPGRRHWGIFADLVRTTHATANLVPDAYLAALALENGATFVTRDRGFARFPGLRTVDPLAA